MQRGMKKRNSHGSSTRDVCRQEHMSSYLTPRNVFSTHPDLLFLFSDDSLKDRRSVRLMMVSNTTCFLAQTGR